MDITTLISSFIFIFARFYFFCGKIDKTQDFPGGLAVKNLPANAGDLGLIPGSGRSPGEENGNPLQYSCLENSLERGARWATVHRVTKSRTRRSPHGTQAGMASQETLLCLGAWRRPLPQPENIRLILPGSRLGAQLFGQIAIWIF